MMQSAKPVGSPTLQSRATSLQKVSQIAIVGLFILALITGLYFTKAVFAPIILALLIAMILHMPARMLERRGVPRPIGAVLLLLLFGTIFFALTAVITPQVQSLTNQYPQMVSDIRDKLWMLRQSLSEAEKVSSTLKAVGEDVQQIVEDDGSEAQEVVVRENKNFLVQAATSFAAFLSTALATIVLCGFILSIRRPFMAIATLPYAEFTRKRKAARLWLSIEERTSRFFLITSLINAGLGAVVALVLWSLDFPSPIFWGIVVGLLNYLPFVGPTIGTVFIVAVGVVHYDTMLAMLVPAILYLAINMVEANFVTPNLVGRQTNVTPISIIVALMFWGWLWGGIGLLVSIPFLVVLTALASEIPSLGILNRLLKPRRSHTGNLFAVQSLQKLKGDQYHANSKIRKLETGN